MGKFSNFDREGEHAASEWPSSNEPSNRTLPSFPPCQVNRLQRGAVQTTAGQGCCLMLALECYGLVS